MTKLLDRLNSLVFFWPGNDKGSIPNGQSHFASADGPTDPVTLRVPTKDVFEKGQPLSANTTADRRGLREE
jgi:hypothetical protein